MMQWISRVLGDGNERELKGLQPSVQRVNELEADTQALSDERLRDKTTEFRGRYLAGESLDDLLPEAYAAAREAARRTVGLRPFDVQILAGIVLHQGKIAEMKTGEGKTLVATLPLYLNALTGNGCHLVTPNDYLSRLGGGWMGPIYHLLGIRVGVIAHEFSAIYDPTYQDPQPHGDVRLDHWRPVPRREAYLADITYGTNNEFGFDYLRDNMVHDLSQCAQRELNYAIVDEVDNILIDEARTPLIISGQADESTDQYYLFARLVPRLKRGTDFQIDEKLRVVTTTEEGIAKIEGALGIENLYAPEHFELTRYLDQALKAQFIFRRDRDYVLYKDGRVLEPHQHARDAEVVIVDEFTGRLMLGRRYSEGLHQAIEAKENVKIQRESQTLATITFQNYFRMYEKLAGMTGTAATEKEEFQKIYDLDVVVIPTNKPMQRADHPDLVYKTEAAKFQAAVEEIAHEHERGRPVLVGTVSIEKSEELSGLLEQSQIPHQMLNAKHHEQEALIIAQAGRPGAVTIATNMAGRGVDILLGGNSSGLAVELLQRQKLTPETATPEQVAEARCQAEETCHTDAEVVRTLGGLHVIGTERHEARRIDNQLRGRAGRQGDSGSSRFYVSLEDDLMRRFGGTNIAGLMDRLGLDDDVPIEHGLVSKAIENAQTKVEGHNFDLRKHVVEYDDVMNKQREVIYAERRKVLGKEELKPIVLQMVEKEVRTLATQFCEAEDADEWDIPGLASAVGGILPLAPELADELRPMSRDEIAERLLALANAAYEKKEQRLGDEVIRQIERLVMLHVIDRHWVDHLTGMEELRHGIGLRAYGQQNPLVEYKAEAYRMFQALLEAIQRDIAHTIYHVDVQREAPRPVAQAVRTNRDEAAEPARAPARAERKTGRNDPCPCGSGKKYKKCHGK
ncbi:MAG: preprotein translocase subunit SecA [Chloroflexi bacterium]|nr:preprotein translocase subunit SecA [Chloroflexota bacterium]